MTDMQMFMKLIRNQQKPKGGDWHIYKDIEITSSRDGDFNITIDEECIGFVFDRITQQFKYIFNWKE